jgi:hypothetical protein
VSRTVSPTRTARYRIDASGASSSAVLVRVAPLVRLTRPAEPGVLLGTVRPRLPGAAVNIEHREGTSWVAVADTVVDKAGAFRVQLELVRGSYRARVPATGNFAEGVGAAISVTQ